MTALGTLEKRLAVGTDNLLKRRELSLRAVCGKFESLSPLAVLSRGYGAVFSPEGDVITGVAGLAPGDAIHTRMRDGEIVSTVTEINPVNNNEVI